MPISTKWAATVVVAATVFAAGPDARAVESLLLFPISPADLPVGTTIFFKAAPASADAHVFRFRVGTAGGASSVVRDFAPRSYLDWTPMDDGAFDIEATARNLVTGDITTAAITYTVSSRVTAGTPVVSPTRHPLVALYSAPPCETGLIRVRYSVNPGGREQATPFKLCRPGRSVNFHVAGLYADTPYLLRHEIVAGDTTMGPTLTHRTPVVTAVMPPTLVLNPHDDPGGAVEGIVLHGTLADDVRKTATFATDLEGRALWYYDKSMFGWQVGSHILRPLPGGNLLMSNGENGVAWQMLREMDIAGNSIRETTVPRVNEQLAALGHDPVTALHHDALRLPNGRMLVLGSVERLLTGVQGPGTVNVLGDMLIELDSEWQVTWAWNAFDHLDPRRAAVLRETCTGPLDGCRPLTLAPRANDWTHTNSIAYSPADGNVLLSVRNQDWIVKVDYRDGTGTGAIVWRLGKDGDFSLAGNNDRLWFSHQHDVSVDSANTLLLYDNGNARCRLTPPPCQSRGQILQINELLRTATLRMNVGLGHYARVVGSAQRLANGNYHFGSGWVYPGPHSEALEVSPVGGVTYRLAAASITYRSWRMRDLYTP